MSLSSEAQAFGEQWNVSRETSERLDLYVALLRKWNRRINLVSSRSLDAVWTRHIADSAQLHELAKGRHGAWADLGSGGGLPGLVVAIMSGEAESPRSVALVESDERKAAFLSQAARVCDLSVSVIRERIEVADSVHAQIVSARALAPLATLLEFACRHVASGGICLFPKGETVHTEVEAARSRWRFEPTLHASRTNPGSFIVEIGEFERV